jgi:hypothetical protein
VSGLVVDRLLLSTPAPLPSHLAILSMASHASQRLAIDSDNHLFFSQDEGRNWKAVSAPWKGRPISVALISASALGSAVPALKISSRPAGTAVSTLSGAITDPTGAVIPGASVTATNSSGVLVGSATTDDHGQYRMEAVAPGSYRIVVQARGFETEAFSTDVAASQQAVADAMLRVGSAAQTVAVDALPPGPPASPRMNANVLARTTARQSLARFELTTDIGERWTSTDGQSWNRE